MGSPNANTVLPSRGNGRVRVAFYTRISTDEDHQKYSLGAQKERLEAYCQASYGADCSITEIYRDTDSGTHMNRPGLQQMLDDAQAGVFDVLLVFRVDRLSRKVKELAQMVDELTQHKVALKSITEPFDTTNLAGRMMLQMLGVFAEFEHGTIVERTKVGMERKARGGKWVGGNVPYGYSLDPDKGLVINKDEAVLVRKMFKMYVVGRDGVSAITTKLNRAGYRKRSGKKWDKRMVLHMLRNPTYIGKVRWKELYDGDHEPIVPEALFNMVQTILSERAEESKGRQFHNGKGRLLSGIVRCARCSSPMYGSGGTTKNGRGITYYVCRKRQVHHECDQDYMPAQDLEKIIVDDIKAFFRDEMFLARVWEEANQKLQAEKPDLDAELSKVGGDIDKAKASMDRYFDAFEQGTLNPEVCNNKVQDLHIRLEELKAQKVGLEAKRDNLKLPELDPAFIASLLDDFERLLEAGTKEQRKHLLRLLVKEVRIHERRTVEVWYGVPNRMPVRTLAHMAPRANVSEFACVGLYTLTGSVTRTVEQLKPSPKPGTGTGAIGAIARSIKPPTILPIKSSRMRP